MSENNRPLTVQELAKVEAETARLLLQTADEHAAAKAEAAKQGAETRKANAEAEVAEAQAVAARILADRETEKRQHELSGAEHQRVYLFNDAVADASVHKCMAELRHWNRIDSGCDVEICFNSPGGSVFAGMELFDYIQELRRSGHRITTATRGMAASMAGILLQAGDIRVMGAESYVLIHDIATWTSGKTGDIEDELELLKKMTTRVVDIFAARSTLSKAAIRKGFTRKDWWLSSTDCLRNGFVDEIR